MANKRQRDPPTPAEREAKRLRITSHLAEIESDLGRGTDMEVFSTKLVKLESKDFERIRSALAEEMVNSCIIFYTGIKTP